MNQYQCITINWNQNLVQISSFFLKPLLCILARIAQCTQPACLRRQLLLALADSQNVPVLGDPDGFGDHSLVILQKNLPVKMCLFFLWADWVTGFKKDGPHRSLLWVCECHWYCPGSLGFREWSRNSKVTSVLLCHCTCRRKSLWAALIGIVEAYATHSRTHTHRVTAIHMKIPAIHMIDVSVLCHWLSQLFLCINISLISWVSCSWFPTLAVESDSWPWQCLVLLFCF